PFPAHEECAGRGRRVTSPRSGVITSHCLEQGARAHRLLYLNAQMSRGVLEELAGCQERLQRSARLQATVARAARWLSRAQQKCLRGARKSSRRTIERTCRRGLGKRLLELGQRTARRSAFNRERSSTRSAG